MSQVKERMTEIIRAQPDDSTFEEILRELAFAHMVDRGLEDSRDGKLISNEEVRRRLDAWRK
jgi:predicted transcriptional regulator